MARGKGEKLTYRFTIDGRLPGNNEFIRANRTNPHKGNSMKKSNEEIIIWAIRQQLKRLKIHKPVHIHYRFVEKDKRRDKDNIASFAMKVIQDSLVKAGTLKNDGWKEVESFSCTFGVDKKRPRIEVEITEVEDV